MKKIILSCITILWAFSFASAYITEALDNWTLGPNQPTIQSGTRGDGSTGSYHYLPVGTSSYYYEVMSEGKGGVDFWIYDPGKCLADPDPGYGSNGPIWGLQNPLYQAMTVGIIRKTYIQGCRGYNVWSTVAPYSPWWFMEFYGLRGTDGAPFTAGWYRWGVSGTLDDITFTLYNVTNFENGVGPGYVVGDVSQTINAASFGGSLAAAFGNGWKAFYLKGDVATTGIEDIKCVVTGGSGEFAEYGPSPVVAPYTRQSWGGIKNLFR
jgi:hypothetical protein